jgi:hypothetical protein
MITALFNDVNWLSVLVATVVYFVLGAIWYGAFANPWMIAVGKTREELQRGSKVIYLYAFIAQLFTCLALSWVVRMSDSSTIASGIELGFIVGICFSVTGSAVNNIFAFRPRNLILIDCGYNLVGIVLSSVILTMWQ